MSDESGSMTFVTKTQTPDPRSEEGEQCVGTDPGENELVLVDEHEFVPDHPCADGYCDEHRPDEHQADRQC